MFSSLSVHRHISVGIITMTSNNNDHLHCCNVIIRKKNWHCTLFDPCDNLWLKPCHLGENGGAAASPHIYLFIYLFQ